MPAEQSITIRVHYAQTDQMGVAHHSNWPVYWEECREELIRARCKSYALLESEDGILLPVVDFGAEILAPVHYDDLIEISCRVEEIGRVRARFRYEARVAGVLVARGHTVHAVVDRDWKPTRLPAHVAESLRGG